MSTGVQNAQLRQALEQWLQASLPILSSYLSGESAEFAKWLIANAMISSDSPFYALPETQALLSLAQTVPEYWAVDPSALPSAAGGIYNPDELIRDVIAGFTRRYFRQHPGPGLDQSAFDALYGELEAYLYDYSNIPYTATIELWHVEADDPPITLSQGIAIRRLTEVEKKAGSTSRAAGIPTPSPYQTHPGPELLIEINGHVRDLFRLSEFKSTWEDSGVRFEATRWGDYVLLGLRLLQKGDIGVGSLNITWGNELLESKSVDLTESTFDGWRYLSGPRPIYRLSPDDAKTLQKIWPFMAKNRSKKRKRLALPVRRFQSSFRRTSSEDRFIDHWISLEALFSSEGSEATFRMSQLLGQFIGRDPLDRWETFKQAKESYRVRSDIVHGRTIDHSTLEDEIAQTEDFLRRALLACMKQRSAPDLGKLGRDVFLQGAVKAGK